MKLYWLKNKKAILISLGVLFVVSIFFINSNSNFKNKEEESGLVVNTEVFGNLLNKDSDKDGMLDWEEGLWGTDPHNRDTDGNGIDDKSEIETKKLTNGFDTPAQDPDTLTQTDKFSQELFAAVAALSQSGELDQVSIDQISEALKEQIQNKTVKKVFTSSDLSISGDNSEQAFISYNNTLNIIYAKYPIQNSPLEIFQEFVGDGVEVNPEALLKLDPIIKQTEGFVNEMTKMSVPSNLVQAHLDMLNALERVSENLNDIGLIEADPLIAMGAISKYEENTELFSSAVDTLINTMQQEFE